MSDKADPTLQKSCLDAFAMRDFKKCARLGLQLLSQDASIEVIQAYLISCQRTGQTQAAGLFGTQILAALADRPWEFALVELTLGRADLSTVLARADNDEHRCQALFYAGARLLTAGNTTQADTCFDKCLELDVDCVERGLADLEKRTILPTGHQALYQQAMHLKAQGHYKPAIQLAQRAIAEAEQVAGGILPYYPLLLNGLAELYRETSRHAEAEPLYAKARETLAQDGDRQSEYATTTNNLALSYAAVGRFEEAEELYTEAMRIDRELFDEPHENLARDLSNLGLLYISLRRFDEAESCFREAIEIDRTVLGEDHIDYAGNLDSLGGLYFEMGRPEDAVPLHEQALKIQRQQLGERHPSYAITLANLATAYRRLGNSKHAAELYEQVIERFTETFGEEHPTVITSMGNLAGLHHDRNEHEQAEALLRKCLHLSAKVFGEDHSHRAVTLNNLGHACEALGKSAEAEQHFRHACEIFKESIGEHDPRYVAALQSLASVLATREDFAAASRVLDTALRVITEHFSGDSSRLVGHLTHRAALDQRRGDMQAAARTFREALQVHEDSGESDPAVVSHIQINLACCLFACGEADEARRLVGSAVSAAQEAGQRLQAMPSLESLAGPDQRTVRVFISSTFRDMHEDREELVKRVFPELRQMCEERGVNWREIDLRWGIAEEESDRGNTLAICLDEIDRCRPYFIGILGERYGSVPGSFDQALIERNPWLEDAKGKSVTELEILHGVLNNPQMANRACFYFRDPAYIETLSADQQRDAVEQDEANRKKLQELKERIRGSGVAVRDYADLKQLGQLVLRDLKVAINQQYPPDSNTDDFLSLKNEQQMVARKLREVYVRNEEVIDQLDQYGSSESSRIVVVGDPGSGKSALLANWAAALQAAYPDWLVFEHYIGATSGDEDWTKIAARLTHAVGEWCSDDSPPPTNADLIMPALHARLERAATLHPATLVLDGIDQLEDPRSTPLQWIESLPQRTRIIVSVESGAAVEAFTSRGWKVLQVQPLGIEQRSRLIADDLARYCKSLDQLAIGRIAEAEQAENPLFLRLLLNELRLFGSREKLGRQIDRYLTADSIDGLYRLILDRWEQDYTSSAPHLVEQALSLLWASRRGLPEAELLDLLGDGENPFPQAYWSPFFLATVGSLVQRRGLIRIANQHLRKAIVDRYLTNADLKTAAHNRLADYAQTRETARTTEDLPSNLIAARDWDGLYELLRDRRFLLSSSGSDDGALAQLWALLERESHHDMLEGYRFVIDDPQGNLDLIFNVAAVLKNRGANRESVRLNRELAQHCRGENNDQGLAATLDNLARGLLSLGDYDEALQVVREAEDVCERLDERRLLFGVYNTWAIIQREHGDLAGALELHEKQERIARSVGDLEGVGIAVGNQGLILKVRADLNGALAKFRQGEQIARETGDQARLAASLGNQALVMRARGELDEAKRLMQEQERMGRELGDLEVVSIAQGNQALLLLQQGKFEEALPVLEEVESICRRLDLKNQLGTILLNQTAVYRERGDYARAWELLDEHERISKELGDISGRTRSLFTRAVLCIDHDDDVAKALSLMEQGYELAATHGYDELAAQIKPQLELLRSMGQAPD